MIYLLGFAFYVACGVLTFGLWIGDNRGYNNYHEGFYWALLGPIGLVVGLSCSERHLQYRKVTKEQKLQRVENQLDRIT